MAKKRNFMRNLRSRFGPALCFLIALAFILAPTYASALVVDTWQGDQFLQITSGTGNDVYAPGGSDPIGGQREFDLTFISGASDLTMETILRNPPNANVMAYSENSSVRGNGKVTWDNSPGGGWDMTDGGTQTHFNFRWLLCDHLLTIDFIVTDAGGSTTHTFNLLAGVPQENVQVPFSNFAPRDMTAVTKMELIVNEGDLEDDLSVGPIITLGPELSCEKTFDGQATVVVEEGDTVAALVTIVNSGDVAANVEITDTLDLGLQYVANSAQVYIDAVPQGQIEPTGGPAGPLVWETGVSGFPSIGVGETLTIEYDIYVDDIEPLEELCNDVVVREVDSGTILADDCYACVTAEDLTVDCEKIFSTHTVDIDDVITATVDIGVAPLGATVVVEVVDTLDLGLIYEAATTIDQPDIITGDGITTPQVLTWNNDTVTRTAPLQLVYDIKVIEIDPGEQLCNSVEVYDEDGVPFDPPVECYDCVSLPAVPTFTQWGIIGLTFLLSVSGVWLTRRRRSKK